MADQDRIVDCQIDGESFGRRTPQVEHERRVAIFDLLEDNAFAPECEGQGPYALRLSLADDRLMFDVRTPEGAPVAAFGLPLRPFRALIRDYLMVCDSYYAAIRTSSPSRIEAIDMGRRSLHNEGGELVRQRLAGKAEVDSATARRLFTLLCTLQIR